MIFPNLEKWSKSGSDGAEAYVVLLAPFSSDESSYEVTLARDLAAVHVSGWNPTIPRWFADGMAYWTVAKMFKRNKALENLDQSAFILSPEKYRTIKRRWSGISLLVPCSPTAGRSNAC